jgi:hypothetical protein
MQTTTHTTVRKNSYISPSWLVYHGDLWIGSAHSIHIAHTAADITAHHARGINPSNCCSRYLIDNVLQDMTTRGYLEYWTPAQPQLQTNH